MKREILFFVWNTWIAGRLTVLDVISFLFLTCFLRIAPSTAYPKILALFG